jgi:thiol-disulfide isomerase/thioredoxin
MTRAIAAWFLIFPLFAHPQLPDAKELLKQTTEAFTLRRSYQYETDMVIDLVIGGNPVHVRLTTSLSVVNPGKKRIESRGQMGDTTIISDGEFTWSYVPALKQYTRKAVIRSAQATLDSIGTGSLAADISKATDALKTLRDESIEIDGSKYACWVIETRIDSVKLPQPEGAELTGVITLWIDKDLKIQRKMSMVGTMQGGPITTPIEVKQTMTNRAVKLDLDLPDSLFAFTPPEGAKEVPDFALAPTKTPNMVGKAAPAFRVTSLAGENFDLAGLKGKTVLLDFWATWCGPCRKEMPTMEKIHQEFKAKGLVIVGLNVGEDRGTVEKFLKTAKVTYPIALTVDTDVTSAFEVTAYPTYVVIDREGNIAGYQVGSAGEAALRETLAKGGIKAGPPK